METKNVTFKFKSIKKAAARPSFELALQFALPEDVLSNNETLKETHIIAAINDCIERYAKKLIADKDADWNYRPDAQKCTLAAWYEYETSARGGWTRVVTKATLAAAGAFYGKYSPLWIGKNATAAAGGQAIIAAGCATIIGNVGLCQRILESLVAMESAVVSEELSESVQAIRADAYMPHEATFDHLRKVLTDAIAAEATKLSVSDL